MIKYLVIYSITSFIFISSYMEHTINIESDCELLNRYYFARYYRDEENHKQAMVYLNRALRCMNKHDYKFYYLNNRAIYDGIHTEVCASAFYDNEIKKGRDSCLFLINHSINESYRKLAKDNIKFYKDE